MKLSLTCCAPTPSRDGFSFTDHPPSGLSNSDLGWIQIGNFVVVGAMLAAAGIVVVHGLAFFVGFGALVAVCFVFANRYIGLGRPAWRSSSTTRAQEGVVQ